MKDFSTTFTTDRAPAEVFSAINRVTEWWIDEIEGHSGKLHDEFSVRFADVHYSKQKLVEFIPEKKVTWLVTDSNLSFLSNRSEWTGTRITFDISREGDKTKVRFTHSGLVPEIECYRDCSNAWSEYVNSLLQLVKTRKGQPYQVVKV